MGRHPAGPSAPVGGAVQTGCYLLSSGMLWVVLSGLGRDDPRQGLGCERLAAGVMPGGSWVVQAGGIGEEGLAGWNDGLRLAPLSHGGEVGVSGLSGLAGTATRSWGDQEGLAWVAWWGEERETRKKWQI